MGKREREIRIRMRGGYEEEVEEKGKSIITLISPSMRFR